MPEPTDPSPGPTPGSVADWGLSSAAAVVERMLELGRAGAAGLRLSFPVNGAPPATGAPAPTAPGPTAGPPGPDGAPTAGPGDPPADVDPAERAREARRFRADAERLVELYADWTRMLVDGAASLAEQAAGPAADSAAPAGGPAPGALVLGPASSGATTTASAWLHVLDGPATSPAALRSTDLVAHDGSSVPGAALRCSPEALDTSVARTTSEVRVTVRVPEGTPPGAYHGHLLATGLPEVVLPVRLEVVA